jgi:BON domain-containing protein
MSSDRFRGGESRWNRGDFEQEQGRYESRERYGRGYEGRRESEYREPFEQERWGEQGQGRFRQGQGQGQWNQGQGQWGQGSSSYEGSRGQGRGDSQADGEPYEGGEGRGQEYQSYGRHGMNQQYGRYGSSQAYGEGRGTWEGDRRESRSYGSGRAESSGGSPSYGSSRPYGSSGSYGSGRRVSSFGSERSSGFGRSSGSGYGEEQWRPSDRFDGYDRSFESGRSYGRPGQGFTRGRFTGKGPKGYQRSDERIKEDVSEALSRDGDLDASEIEVIVVSGEVTLEGTVPDRQSKRLAEDLAEDLPGVKQVQNRLRIENGQGRREGESSTSGSTSGSISGSSSRGSTSSSTSGSRSKSSI